MAWLLTAKESVDLLPTETSQCKGQLGQEGLIRPKPDEARVHSLS